MDLSPHMLFAGFIVSTVGFGIFLYGKKQARAPQLVVGVALMAFPCLGTGALLTWCIGGALVLALTCSVRLGL